MMKKNIISLILIAMVISIIIALVFWLKPNRVTVVPKPEILPNTVSQNPIELDVEQQQLGQLKAGDVIKRFPHLKLDKQTLIQATFEKHLFNEVSLEKIRSRMPIDFSEDTLNDGRLFSEYDPLVIETKGVGDKIQWQALEYGLNQVGVIQEVEDLGDDIYRWTGHFEGKDPLHNHFRITQSLDENYAIARINTEQGTFEFEAKNGIGWMRPSIVKDTDLHAEDTHHHE